jgi:hypothetical protein
MEPEGERREGFVLEALAFQIRIARLLERAVADDRNRRKSPGGKDSLHPPDVSIGQPLFGARVGKGDNVRSNSREFQRDQHGGGIDPSAEADHQLAATQSVSELQYLLARQEPVCMTPSSNTRRLSS